MALVVSVTEEPVVFLQGAHEVLTGLIITENDSTERHGRDPVEVVDRTSTEREVEGSHVTKKGTESSFPSKSKI